MSKRRLGFKCASCGKWHAHAPTDMGFALPDEVWAIHEQIREERALFDEDLCRLDKKRYFIRGVLKVPFLDKEGYFGWGFWVEVKKRDFFKYIDQHNSKRDGSAEKRFPGRIANALAGYPVLGREVEVQLGLPENRPTFWFPRSARHKMSMEQRRGITTERQMQMLHQDMPSAFH